MKTTISLLILATACYATTDSTMNLKIQASYDSAKLKVVAWEKRMNAESDGVINALDSNGNKQLLAIGDLRYLATSYRITIDSISEDYSEIQLKWKSYLSEQGKGIIYPKINDAFRQGLGEPVPNGKTLQRKSLAKYLGYSIINTGVGALYLKDNSFTYQAGYPLIIATAAADAGLVAFAIASPKGRPIGIACIVLYRAISLLGIPALNLHNKFSESGYQYSF